MRLVVAAEAVAFADVAGGPGLQARQAAADGERQRVGRRGGAGRDGAKSEQAQAEEGSHGRRSLCRKRRACKGERRHADEGASLFIRVTAACDLAYSHSRARHPWIYANSASTYVSGS